MASVTIKDQSKMTRRKLISSSHFTPYVNAGEFWLFNGPLLALAYTQLNDWCIDESGKQWKHVSSLSTRNESTWRRNNIYIITQVVSYTLHHLTRLSERRALIVCVLSRSCSALAQCPWIVVRIRSRVSNISNEPLAIAASRYRAMPALTCMVLCFRCFHGLTSPSDASYCVNWTIDLAPAGGLLFSMRMFYTSDAGWAPIIPLADGPPHIHAHT